MMVASLAGASAARATVSVDVGAQFVDGASVGYQGATVSVTLKNISNGPQAADHLRVAIALTPSCGVLSRSSVCPAGFEDPGVYQPSKTGVGDSRTGCAGKNFSFVLRDARTGRYSVASTPALILGAAGSAAAKCTINFTVSVLKTPTKDADPRPGLQTALRVAVSAIDTTKRLRVSTIIAFNTTVNRAAVPMSTSVSNGSIALRQSFTDAATITKPSVGPALTGTVSFVVYGPNDATCSGPRVFPPSAVAVGADGRAMSGSFTPTAAGAYRVVATYSGDSNYLPLTGACGDAGESVNVAPAPAVTTGLASPIGGISVSLPGTVNTWSRTA